MSERKRVGPRGSVFIGMSGDRLRAMTAVLDRELKAVRQRGEVAVDGGARALYCFGLAIPSRCRVLVRLARRSLARAPSREEESGQGVTSASESPANCPDMQIASRASGGGSLIELREHCPGVVLGKRVRNSSRLSRACGKCGSRIRRLSEPATPSPP